MDNMGSYSQAQWPEWTYNGNSNTYNGYAQLPSYTTYLPESMELYSAQQSHLIHHQQMARTTDPKPRLSKEEVEILEAEFQKNHKPNSSTKKGLAEQMRVENARINNWFQNRRAREKKEKNIREYAARQKLERGHSEGGLFLDSDRSHDRVASSAPFPDPRRPSIKTEASEPSLSDLATPDHESETSHSDASSPYISAHATPDRALSFDPVDAKDYLSLGHQGFMQDSASTFLSLSETSTNVQDTALSFPNFNQFPQVIIMPNGEGETTPSFTQHCFPGTPGLSPNSAQDSYSQFSESDYDESSLTADVDAQDALKSPRSMDIASRRNRRPPHLAINASRSFSGCGPKTAGDLGRRSDIGGSMHRVASVTGTARVSKQGGTPRSPYYERNPEVLFQLNRSPSFTPATATVAPPTPNTPVVSDRPDNEKTLSDLPIHDPTLRTPPTTPGVMDNMFVLNAAYEGPVCDEHIVTPGLTGFSNDFEVPGMSGNVPHYITNGCVSQPQTPSYTPQMGPNYFGYSGGNAEYNWSDTSASAKSSPGQSHRQVQFMNMTLSNFAHVEK